MVFYQKSIGSFGIRYTFRYMEWAYVLVFPIFSGQKVSDSTPVSGTI